MPPWHSTSVHWVADLENHVQKSCIVSADGGRFLVLQGKTLVADCPQCGIWSTEELRGDLSSFLRAFLIKAGMSRKSRATTFSFSRYHSLFIPRLWKWQCRISRARSVIPPLPWRRSYVRSRESSEQDCVKDFWFFFNLLNTDCLVWLFLWCFSLSIDHSC